MSNDIGATLLFLGGLVALSVVFAGVGTSFGQTDPLREGGPTPKFVVSDENVSFADGERTATVVENLSRVGRIEIERRDDGGVHISTAPDQQRERAKAIATANATVRDRLDEVGDYRLTVAHTYRVEAMNATARDAGDDAATFELRRDTASSDEDGVVVVERAPAADDGTVTLQVEHADSGEVRYSVRVDLTNGTVTQITEGVLLEL
ncbi:hypothetical protein [Natrinema salaciae]|uniref:Uncharacterized protein n=1 Tax=Natrinema salaciae TaxID=1186196 RepID=A0A1H9LE13_9EURY|nr:hypothetical protein [Natrinema salaciae]SER09676.1 hypothetical protein SAMN04489841_2939 [Natrinema salaciae]